MTEKYNEKIRRLEKSAALEPVDRVPLAAATLYFPAKYHGITYEDMFYDNGKYAAAAEHFARDFDWDAACFLRSFESVPLGLSLVTEDVEKAINTAIASVLGGGFTHEIFKDIYCKQPGRELGVWQESQFTLEEPLCSGDEYDELGSDPLGFIKNKLLPRVYRSLSQPGSETSAAAWRQFDAELPGTLGEVVDFTKKMKEADCPPWYMALAPNPLDVLGAFIRNFGTVMTDIHRYPKQVEKFCENMAPVFLAVGKATGKLSLELTGSKRVFCPVWYNTFLSNKEFRRFHWPYLKFIAEGLIGEGFTPLLSLQGEHDHLLDTLLELPEGKFIAWFDRTDPIDAKKVIGEHCCIAGGISPSVLIGGTPDQTDEYIKKMFAEMKKSRGFICTLPFNAIGPAKPENVRAMTDAVRKYGAY